MLNRCFVRCCKHSSRHFLSSFCITIFRQFNRLTKWKLIQNIACLRTPKITSLAQQPSYVCRLEGSWSLHFNMQPAGLVAVCACNMHQLHHAIILCRLRSECGLKAQGAVMMFVANSDIRSAAVRQRINVYFDDFFYSQFPIFPFKWRWRMKIHLRRHGETFKLAGYHTP